MQLCVMAFRCPVISSPFIMDARLWMQDFSKEDMHIKFYIWHQVSLILLKLITFTRMNISSVLLIAKFHHSHHVLSFDVSLD